MKPMSLFWERGVCGCPTHWPRAAVCDARPGGSAAPRSPGLCAALRVPGREGQSSHREGISSQNRGEAKAKTHVASCPGDKSPSKRRYRESERSRSRGTGHGGHRPRSGAALTEPPPGTAPHRTAPLPPGPGSDGGSRCGRPPHEHPGKLDESPPPRLPSAPRPGTTHPDACPVTSPDPNGETLGTPGPAALTGQPPGRAVARGRAVLSGHGAAPRAPPRRRGLRHAWPRPAPGSRRRRAAEGGEGRGEGEDPALPARPGPPLPTSPPRPLPLPPPDVPPPDVCSPPPQTPGESFGDEGGEHNVTVPRPIPAPPPPPSPKKKPVCAPSFPQMCSPPPRADAPWAPPAPLSAAGSPAAPRTAGTESGAAGGEGAVAAPEGSAGPLTATGELRESAFEAAAQSPDLRRAPPFPLPSSLPKKISVRETAVLWVHPFG